MYIYIYSNLQLCAYPAHALIIELSGRTEVCAHSQLTFYVSSTFSFAQSHFPTGALHQSPHYFFEFVLLS